MEESTRFISAIKRELEATPQDRDPSRLSMSSLGHCGRQLAYRYHGVAPEAFNWKSYMVFDDGDMHHAQLRLLLTTRLQKEDSCYQLEDQEKEVSYQGIPGHIDGLLKHNDEKCKDKTHTTMLLEVKSMNERAFAEIKKTKSLGYEYACQVSGYLAAHQLRYAVILAKNKNTGDLVEFIYECDLELLAKRLDVIESVVTAEDPEQVDREYGPNKAGNLPWQCGYCPFVKMCWRHEGVMEKKAHKYHLSYGKNNETKESEDEKDTVPE